MMTEKYCVYDLETLSNCFTGVFKDFKTGKLKEFVIHKSRNDLGELIKFLKQLKIQNYWMVGFNNVGFDAQIIEYLIRRRAEFKNMKAELLADKIHDLAQRIINLPDEEKFSQLIPEWELSLPQIDIFKQQHYYRPEKATSLKWLEFTMRFPNIQSMPFKHDEYIHEFMIPDVLDYNRNDVDATAEFFKRIFFETELRHKLSKEYDLHLMNSPEPRLAREIFGKFMSEAMGVPYRDLKERRSYRRNVVVKNVLFPYVKFNDPVLKAAHNFYKKLEFNPYSDKYIENNMDLSPVQKTFKFHNLPEVVIGLGGIHGCVHSGIYESSKDWIIHDWDVKSYYPNLGIKNELYPEHLSLLFCEIYENLYEMRTKIPKESPVNYIFKIILNAAYGLSQEPNNYFHDPNYTFGITVNGQLLLLMMAEMIRDAIPDIVFYQFNTDGITLGYHPKHKKTVQKVMNAWQKLTKLELEDKLYTKMVIKDVNNYLAVDDKGKVKRKGSTFAYSLDPEDKELYYHKNTPGLVIPKALEQYFIYGVPFEKYVKECKDIFDFCFGIKVKRSFDLLQHKLNKNTGQVETNVLHEQVVRYYMSTEPATLRKRFKPGTKSYGKTPVALQKKWNQAYYNRHEEKEMSEYSIDYRFYLSKIRKVIHEIDPHIGNQKILFK